MRLLATLGSALVIALMPQSAALAAKPENFASVRLPRGIEIQVPNGWRLITPEFKQLIDTSTQAALELSGLDTQEGDETNLIAANSMPASTYAAIRVDLIRPSSIQPSEFASIKATEMREMQTEMEKNIRILLPHQGLQLIKFEGVRIDIISGYPAIVTEYSRTGPKGSVLVQISQIFTRGQSLRINLSYRASESIIWKPVIAKIRRSIVIRRGM